MTAHSKLYTGTVWIILVAVVAAFWLTVFKLSYNFPFYDDFDNIVQFILRFRGSSGLWTKLALLFEQNFEHRVLFSKLVTLMQYYLTGQVNIRWLIMLGDLSLIGIAWLFYTFYGNKKLSLATLLGICCILFQMQHYEDTISWATCSLQHAPCILFSLWSSYLALQRKHIWGSAVLALLALFTSANGVAAILVWILNIWLVTQQGKKALLPTLMILVATGIHLATLRIHSGSLLDNAFSNVFPKTFILFSFAGQLADPELFGMLPSVVLGFVVVLPLLIVIVKGIRKERSGVSHLQWVCAAGIGALLFVGFLIVFARGAEPDYFGYQMDRYKIYAALFGVLALGFYDGYADRIFAGEWVRHAVVLGLLVFSTSTYYLYYGDVRYYRSGIKANQFNFLWSKRIYYPLIFEDSTSIRDLTAAQQGPLRNSHPAPASPLLTADWTRITDTLMAETILDDGNIRLKNDDFAGLDRGEQLFAVALSEDQPRYLLKVDFEYRRSPRLFYTTFTRPMAPGFGCLIFKNKMKAGVYDVRLVSIKKGREARVYHLSKVTI